MSMGLGAVTVTITVPWRDPPADRATSSTDIRWIKAERGGDDNSEGVPADFISVEDYYVVAMFYRAGHEGDLNLNLSVGGYAMVPLV